MAKMIVHRGGTFRRPKSKFSFTFKPSPAVQHWPEDVVAYAVAAGMAERVIAHKRKSETGKEGG